VGFRRAARTTAAARDLVEQVMLSVVEANETAIAMYERFGFRRYGTESRALKSTAGYANQVLMVLCLDDLTPSLPNPDPTASDA
jgi:ribosomal protein S18 acetylase RimI-like enzyme